MTSNVLLFSPDHLVDDADIGLDDFHDLVGDVFVGVVRNRDSAAVFLLTDHLDGRVDRLQKPLCIDAGEDEAGFVQRLGAFGGGANADGRERMPDRGEERGFLGQRAGIGHDTSGVHLQAVVVVESKRLVLDHAFIELETGRFEAFSASGVAGIQDRHIVLLCHPIDRGEEADEISVVVDVFFAMSGKQDIFAFFEAEPLMDVGAHDLVKILVQDLGHRGARDIGAFLRQAAVGEVTPGMLRIRQVDIADDVDDAAVGFLWQAFVLAAVSGLHVENRNVQAFRPNHGEAAVGIAKYEHGIRLDLDHQFVGTCDDISHGFAEVAADCVQVDFRLGKLKIAEKDAVQRIIVILSSVSENDIEILAAFLDHAGQTDNLRARADDDQKFQFAVVFPDRFVFHASDLFEECIGIGRVVELVDPENGIEIIRTDVFNVVRIPDGHIDK